MVIRNSPRANAFQPATNPLIESSEVLLLVPKRLFRRPAAVLNSLSKLDHLVNRLLAIQTHDIVVKKRAPLSLRFARSRWQKLHKHRNHHLRPPFTNQRKRAIKIKQYMTDLRTRRKTRCKLDAARKRT